MRPLRRGWQAGSLGGAGMNRRDQLIQEHLNCVHGVIHSSIHVNPNVCGLEYDDLYQEGCIALLAGGRNL